MTIRPFKILAIAAALIAGSVELVVARALPGLPEAARERVSVSGKSRTGKANGGGG